MILATHAVGGAATAILLRRHPILALVAAFLSHFILDAIPHWHYPILSLERSSLSPLQNRIVFNPRFLRDLLWTGIDAGLGMIISLWAALTYQPNYVLLALGGALLGILPDFLQLCYYIFPKLFRPLQQFHVWVHARIRLDAQHSWGIVSQIVLIFIFIGCIVWG